MTSISDDLQTLRHLRNDGKLIPFVGAGLSKPLGLPSWGDLINPIAEEFGYDPEVFKCNGNELQLAEYYVETKGSIGPLRSVMDREFNPSDKQIQTSRTHGALVEMKLPLIYTTNFHERIPSRFNPAPFQERREASRPETEILEDCRKGRGPYSKPIRTEVVAERRDFARAVRGWHGRSTRESEACFERVDPPCEFALSVRVEWGRG
jgi:hypothetical protein